MDTKSPQLLNGADKHANPVKDKLTSTLMGYIQKYAMYNLPTSETCHETTSEKNINHLKNTCEEIGATILKSMRL